MRGRSWRWLAATACAFAALSAAVVWAGTSAAYGKFKGKIVISDEEIPADFGGDKEMVAGLKKLNKAAIARKRGEETWHLYFMGFLTKKAGANKINFVFYETVKGKRTYVSSK